MCSDQCYKTFFIYLETIRNPNFWSNWVVFRGYFCLNNFIDLDFCSYSVIFIVAKSIFPPKSCTSLATGHNHYHSLFPSHTTDYINTSHTTVSHMHQRFAWCTHKEWRILNERVSMKRQQLKERILFAANHRFVLFYLHTSMSDDKNAENWLKRVLQQFDIFSRPP